MRQVWLCFESLSITTHTLSLWILMVIQSQGWKFLNFTVNVEQAYTLTARTHFPTNPWVCDFTRPNTKYWKFVQSLHPQSKSIGMYGALVQYFLENRSVYAERVTKSEMLVIVERSVASKNRSPSPLSDIYKSYCHLSILRKREIKIKSLKFMLRKISRLSMCCFSRRSLSGRS